jgi:glutathione S-transferase
MILYDLAGADPRVRLSPYCWRTRLALAHKGLDFETRLWRLTDKEAIAFSGQGLVPVLVDGDRVVSDSWQIACHLEDRYPDRPSLFGGVQGRAHALFVNQWYEHAVRAFLPRMIVLAALAVVDERDREYFRASREARFGHRPLEEVVIPPEQGQALLGPALAPARDVLQRQPWLGGVGPSYADHILFGGFQQARILGIELLAADDETMRAWRERMLDAYGGAARQAFIAPV